MKHYRIEFYTYPPLTVHTLQGEKEAIRTAITTTKVHRSVYNREVLTRSKIKQDIKSVTLVNSLS